ncbi:MAG: hypothetical protein J6M91_08725 [Methanobrevibacter sp.]|nr:hypothetical protein [Methanobrevibacter sp.]
MEAEKIRILFTFDLEQEQLRKYYPGHETTQAYKEIGMFFRKNGFEHNQGSGYISKKSISLDQVIVIAIKLQQKMPWLNKCSSVFELTQIIEQQFDMKKIFSEVEKLQPKLKINKRESHSLSR